MKHRLSVLVVALSLARVGFADILPGFGLEKVADAQGFVTSLAFDADGTLHYSVRDGGIYRLDEGVSSLVANVETWNAGNAALLGIAFLPSGEIVTHHVAPDRTGDVVAKIDLATSETVTLAFFPCPSTTCQTEHHGGNPLVRADGTIFVAIGDLAVPNRVQNPASSSGKIFSISPQGDVTLFALGFRNPFDLAWDEVFGRLIVGDNGSVANDEICFVEQDENHGWPLSMGSEPVPFGVTAPVYAFAETVAPTGLALVSGSSGNFFYRGLLVGAWVSEALYYFPSYGAADIAPPAAVIFREAGSVIDVVQSLEGAVYVATASEIFHLTTPILGDANGDRIVNRDDLDALSLELLDGDGVAAARCHEGLQLSTLGADVNRDGEINALDIVSLHELLKTRRRGVRRP